MWEVTRIFLGFFRWRYHISGLKYTVVIFNNTAYLNLLKTVQHIFCPWLFFYFPLQRFLPLGTFIWCTRGARVNTDKLRRINVSDWSSTSLNWWTCIDSARWLSTLLYRSCSQQSSPDSEMKMLYFRKLSTIFPLTPKAFASWQSPTWCNSYRSFCKQECTLLTY